MDASTQSPMAFVSYSHNDNYDDFISKFRQHLELEVTSQLGSTFVIFQDTDNIQPGQDWEGVLENALANVPLFIPILSPSFVNSEYCKKELDRFLKRERALNRSDLVIPVYLIDSDLLNDKQRLEGHSNQALKAVMRHQYSDWRELRKKGLGPDEFRHNVIKLAEAIKGAIKRSPTPLIGQPGLLNSSVNEIRVILDEIRARILSTNFRRRFRAGITLKVLTAARDEIQRLTGAAEEYHQDLSIEENFIVRAGPIFEEASQIYAISIDQFSAFWIAADQRTRAEEYTSRQPENTIRLFVFSTVENAHKYRYVLAAHYARYGKKGAVLLTSKNLYKQFLAEIDVSSVPELLVKDFAILIFKEDNTAAGELEEREYYEATLSQTKLMFKQIQDVTASYESFIHRFDELRSDVRDGESRNGILKWREELKFNDTLWSAALGKMFGVADSGDTLPVYHIVFLRPVASTIPTLTAHVEEDLRTKIECIVSKESEERLVEEFWFGARNDLIESLAVSDGRYKGPIRLSNELARGYPFCLVLKLKNVRALREYYENVIHSEVRRELLSLCEPKLRNMYKILDKPEKLTEEEQQLIYDAIETSASSVLLRADFVLESPSQGLLKNSPVTFELPKSIGRIRRH